jgi:hypothetical protein
MTDVITAKIMSTEELITLNHRAIKANRNRSFDPRKLEEEIDPDGIHVVWFSMVHNDVEMRVGILLKLRDSMIPIEGFLDMSFDDYAALRSATRESAEL